MSNKEITSLDEEITNNSNVSSNNDIDELYNQIPNVKISRNKSKNRIISFNNFADSISVDSYKTILIIKDVVFVVKVLSNNKFYLSGSNFLGNPINTLSEVNKNVLIKYKNILYHYYDTEHIINILIKKVESIIKFLIKTNNDSSESPSKTNNKTTLETLLSSSKFKDIEKLNKELKSIGININSLSEQAKKTLSDLCNLLLQLNKELEYEIPNIDGLSDQEQIDLYNLCKKSEIPIGVFKDSYSTELFKYLLNVDCEVDLIETIATKIRYLYPNFYLDDEKISDNIEVFKIHYQFIKDKNNYNNTCKELYEKSLVIKNPTNTEITNILINNLRYGYILNLNKKYDEAKLLYIRNYYLCNKLQNLSYSDAIKLTDGSEVDIIEVKTGIKNDEKPCKSNAKTNAKTAKTNAKTNVKTDEKTQDKTIKDSIEEMLGNKDIKSKTDKYLFEILNKSEINDILLFELEEYIKKHNLEKNGMVYEVEKSKNINTDDKKIDFDDDYKFVKNANRIKSVTDKRVFENRVYVGMSNEKNKYNFIRRKIQRKQIVKKTLSDFNNFEELSLRAKEDENKNEIKNDELYAIFIDVLKNIENKHNNYRFLMSSRKKHNDIMIQSINSFCLLEFDKSSEIEKYYLDIIGELYHNLTEDNKKSTEILNKEFEEARYLPRFSILVRLLLESYLSLYSTYSLQILSEFMSDPLLFHYCLYMNNIINFKLQKGIILHIVNNSTHYSLINYGKILYGIAYIYNRNLNTRNNNEYTKAMNENASKLYWISYNDYYVANSLIEYIDMLMEGYYHYPEHTYGTVKYFKFEIIKSGDEYRLNNNYLQIKSNSTEEVKEEEVKEKEFKEELGEVEEKIPVDVEFVNNFVSESKSNLATDRYKKYMEEKCDIFAKYKEINACSDIKYYKSKKNDIKSIEEKYKQDMKLLNKKIIVDLFYKGFNQFRNEEFLVKLYKYLNKIN